MNKQTHNILDSIGDDGELVHPFPRDNEFNLSGDLLDYVEDPVIIYRYPAHTRLAICWVLYWVLGLVSY